MPTKTKETFLYAPGSLVRTKKEIYSMDPHMMLAEGTVGLILSGPKENYNHHCQVWARHTVQLVMSFYLLVI